ALAWSPFVGPSPDPGTRLSHHAERLAPPIEATGRKRPDVDRGRSTGNEVGNDFACHRGRRHAHMTVTEGVDDVRRGARWPDHRQRIRQARTMAHPHRNPLLRV